MFRPAPALVLAGAVWTALVFTAPLLGWPAIYASAHLVCHQLPDRTFHFAVGPMAVCARCVGLYAGAVAGGVAALVTRRRGEPGVSEAPGRARLILGLATLPTIATLAGEWVLRWPVTNHMRFVAAVPLGMAAAWVVTRALEVDWRT